MTTTTSVTAVHKHIHGECTMPEDETNKQKKTMQTEQETDESVEKGKDGWKEK